MPWPICPLIPVPCCAPKGLEEEGGAGRNPVIQMAGASGQESSPPTPTPQAGQGLRMSCYGVSWEAPPQPPALGRGSEQAGHLEHCTLTRTEQNQLCSKSVQVYVEVAIFQNFNKF